MEIFSLLCKPLLFSSSFCHWSFKFFLPPFIYAPLGLNEGWFCHHRDTQDTHRLSQVTVIPSCHHLSPDCCQIALPTWISTRTPHFLCCFQGESMATCWAVAGQNWCQTLPHLTCKNYGSFAMCWMFIQCVHILLQPVHVYNLESIKLCIACGLYVLQYKYSWLVFVHVSSFWSIHGNGHFCGVACSCYSPLPLGYLQLVIAAQSMLLSKKASYIRVGNMLSVLASSISA